MTEESRGLLWAGYLGACARESLTKVHEGTYMKMFIVFQGGGGHLGSLTGRMEKHL